MFLNPILIPFGPTQKPISLKDATKGLNVGYLLPAFTCLILVEIPLSISSAIFSISSVVEIRILEHLELTGTKKQVPAFY